MESKGCGIESRGAGSAPAQDCDGTYTSRQIFMRIQDIIASGPQPEPYPKLRKGAGKHRPGRLIADVKYT